MNSTKIVLIGDEPNILRTLRRNLVGRGYDVVIALDDVETYEIAAQTRPDLVILNLDFATVKIDGLAICAQAAHQPMPDHRAIGHRFRENQDSGPGPGR